MDKVPKMYLLLLFMYFGAIICTNPKYKSIDKPCYTLTNDLFLFQGQTNCTDPVRSVANPFQTKFDEGTKWTDKITTKEDISNVHRHGVRERNEEQGRRQPIEGESLSMILHKNDSMLCQDFKIEKGESQKNVTLVNSIIINTRDLLRINYTQNDIFHKIMKDSRDTIQKISNIQVNSTLPEIIDSRNFTKWSAKFDLSTIATFFCIIAIFLIFAHKILKCWHKNKEEKNHNGGVTVNINDNKNIGQTFAPPDTIPSDSAVHFTHINEKGTTQVSSNNTIPIDSAVQLTHTNEKGISQVSSNTPGNIVQTDLTEVSPENSHVGTMLDSLRDR